MTVRVFPGPAERRPTFQAIGAYLIGHGTLREPRPIELQWARIRRYARLLREKSRDFRLPLKAFVDLNWPPNRDGVRLDPHVYPGIYDLFGDASEKLIGTVIIDVREDCGPSRRFDWIRQDLEAGGLTVINVFHDSENVLAEYLERVYQGHAYAFQIDDAADFVTFFPALAANVAERALDLSRQARRGDPELSVSDIQGRLHHLGYRNPYSSGRDPFLPEELDLAWREKQKAEEEAVRIERRKTEQLYSLGPNAPGVLLDDYPRYGEPRDTESFANAEMRAMQLGFQKFSDGRLVGYKRELGAWLIYADLRMAGQITFYLYRLPRDSRAKRISDRQFSIHDRLKNDISLKWQAAFDKATRSR